MNKLLKGFGGAALVVSLVLVLGVSKLRAGSNDLAYFGVTELATLAGASVASGDFDLVYDVTANNIVKVDSTSRTIATLDSTTLTSVTYTGSGATILNGTAAFNGATVLGDGATVHSGFLKRIVASTTVAIVLGQCGDTFLSNSADVMTLPEASTVLGCRLTFVCGTADDFDVNPADGTDAFSITGSITGANTTTVLAPSAGDALRCTDIGAGFEIQAVSADLWAVLSTNGIITDVN